ncbi:MAG: hypothetical protein ACYCPQ_02915 [Elusimicrobiota bacterium]
MILTLVMAAFSPARQPVRVAQVHPCSWPHVCVESVAIRPPCIPGRICVESLAS